MIKLRPCYGLYFRAKVDRAGSFIVVIYLEEGLKTQGRIGKIRAKNLIRRVMGGGTKVVINQSLKKRVVLQFNVQEIFYIYSLNQRVTCTFAEF